MSWVYDIPFSHWTIALTIKRKYSKKKIQKYKKTEENHYIEFGRTIGFIFTQFWFNTVQPNTDPKRHDKTFLGKRLQKSGFYLDLHGNYIVTSSSDYMKKEDKLVGKTSEWQIFNKFCCFQVKPYFQQERSFKVFPERKNNWVQVRYQRRTKSSGII